MKARPRSRQSRAVIPIKNYQHAPSPKYKPTLQDQLWRAERDIKYLEREVRQLKDSIRYKNSMLEDEAEYWRNGLEEDEWEGYEAVRRRISRLSGAAGYKGGSE